MNERAMNRRVMNRRAVTNTTNGDESMSGRPGRRTGALTAGIVAIALVLAGCTNSDGADPTSESLVSPGGSLVSNPPTDNTSGSADTDSTSGSQGSATTGSSGATTTSDGTGATSSTGNSTSGTSRTTSPTATGPTASKTGPTKGSGSTKPPASSGTPPVSRSSGVETVVLNAKEIATRKEIETAWLKYWDVYIAFNKIPKAQRPAKFGAVAVDPELADLLRSADLADQKNLVSDGTIGHRVYWSSPVAGRKSVVIGDCVDESHYRSKDLKTGELGKTGGPRLNFNGTMHHTADDGWKVSFLDYREGTSC